MAVTQFRPPFGYLTAAALAFARAQGWEIVLWKRIGYDWRRSATPERSRAGSRGACAEERSSSSTTRTSTARPDAWRATAGSLPLVFERLEARGCAPPRRDASPGSSRRPAGLYVRFFWRWLLIAAPSSSSSLSRRRSSTSSTTRPGRPRRLRLRHALHLVRRLPRRGRAHRRHREARGRRLPGCAS